MSHGAQSAAALAQQRLVAEVGAAAAVPEAALLDLKHLLIEAKQRVPPVLMALDDNEPFVVGLFTQVSGRVSGWVNRPT